MCALPGQLGKQIERTFSTTCNNLSVPTCCGLFTEVVYILKKLKLLLFCNYQYDAGGGLKTVLILLCKNTTCSVFDYGVF